MKPTNHQKGQVVIIAVIFFLIISVAIMASISFTLGNQIKSTRDLFKAKQSYLAADSVNDDALYRLNEGRTLPATLILGFSGGVEATAEVSEVDGNKQIISTGSYGSIERGAKSVYSEGAGVSINYGLQVGSGGITMTNNAVITGNVYSNGNISGSNDARITGSVVASSYTNTTPELTVGTSATPDYGIDLGRSTTGITKIAQSFSISTSTPVAKISLYLKKTGSPSNVTVSIMTNSGGNPNNQQGSSATLYGSQVTTSYGWVDVYPTTPITLTPNTTYWVQLSVSNTSATNYYTIGQVANAYTGGQTKTKAGNGSWATPTPTGQDTYLHLYTGNYSSISGMDSIGGNANAHTVTNSNITGSLYCQNGSGNNKSCDTSQALPSPLGFPYSTANLNQWRDMGSAGQTVNGLSLWGNLATTTSGPLKVNGSVNLSGDSILTLSGPMYVTGNITLSNDSKIQLSNSYGVGDSEIIVVDGDYITSNNASTTGSGASGSYVVVATENGDMTLSNRGGSVVFISLNGTVSFSNWASAKAVTAYRMTMANFATLNYESGLADINFTGGPSGAWNVESWQEIAN